VESPTVLRLHTTSGHETLLAPLSQKRNAGAVVENPVDRRWNNVGYARNRAAAACFRCRFGAPAVWMKKRLPSPARPTMLCVHQPLEHNI
jgi:hypothetical protein